MDCLGTLTIFQYHHIAAGDALAVEPPLTRQ